MMHKLTRSAISGVVVLLMACGEGESGDSFALFGNGEYGYGCEAWREGRPPADRTVFDIPSSGDQKGPLAAAILEMGGWTLPAFNAPKVRAALPVDSLPLLYARGLIDASDVAGTVGDTLDRSVSFIVMLTDTIRVEDLDRVTDAGASIESIYTFINAYQAEGHDSLLPLILEWPNVDVVQSSNLVCMDF
jgi:hypothetical protein